MTHWILVSLMCFEVAFWISGKLYYRSRQLNSCFVKWCWKPFLCERDLKFSRQWMYEGVSKSFRTKSIKKYMLTTINTRWEATQTLMAAKLTRLTHNSDTTAPSGRELYHLQFSLQAANPETFGYTVIEFAVFWIVMPCSVVVGYQRFGGQCCIYLQGWTWRLHGPPRSSYSTTTMHGANTQKTANSKSFLCWNNSLCIRFPRYLTVNVQYYAISFS
jgi:hypothetical protein